MSHTVTATMKLSVSTKGKLALIAAGGGVGGSEAERITKAAEANLGQLVAAARRYGFEISDPRIDVR